MELIQTVTVGAGGAATIEFSVPQTFDDLYLVISPRSSGAPNPTAIADGNIYFNGSNSGYSGRLLIGDGSGAGSGNYTNLFFWLPSANATANTFGSASIYIPNYRSSNAKSMSQDLVTENSAAFNYNLLFAGLWNNSAPITSISLQTNLTTFGQNSSASLYGIRKFNTTTQPKATGGAISYDAVNQKWVHVFTASGTFTPTQNLTGVEYLVVAGGGGGGGFFGGGGGAGGYRSSVIGLPSGGGASAEATLSLTSGVGQTVTVGAGGAPGIGGTGGGGNGSNSIFGSITSSGGGGGAPYLGVAGNGGSGGGAAGLNQPTAIGTGTANQGFNGGQGNSSGNTPSGGGGGASAVGANATTTTGGNGGNGVTSTITGSSVVRAGGGGGGVYDGGTSGLGGSGGGGNGGATAGASTDGSAGVAFTGGGGGGARHIGGTPITNGGAGGSGIVIVRYS